jgi:hypothetical protein
VRVLHAWVNTLNPKPEGSQQSFKKHTFGHGRWVGGQTHLSWVATRGVCVCVCVCVFVCVWPPTHLPPAPAATAHTSSRVRCCGRRRYEVFQNGRGALGVVWGGRAWGGAGNNAQKSHIVSFVE